MDARRRVASPTTRSGGDRSPLSNRANMVAGGGGGGGGGGTNWEHKDSSEGQPSTHDSVCDAAWISTSDLAKSPYQTPGRPVTPLRSIDIDLESESPLSRLVETPFLYGYGTELAPILEQRSIATLRTIGSRSTSDLSSLMHDAPGARSGSGSGKSSSGKTHSKSDNTTATTTTTLTTLTTHSRPLRRQNSFSFDDGDDDGTHVKPTTTPTECGSPQLKQLSFSRPTVHIVDVHAYPRKPIYPPPQRPVTPPSLRRIARPHSEGDAYVASASSGRVAYEAPGFRPPRSGHGNLSAHPFMSSHHHHAPPTLPPPPPPLTTTHTATITTGITTNRTSWSQLRVRRDEGALARTVPSGTRHRENSNRASLDAGYLVPPEPETRKSGICKKCHHPRRERWSLGSTLVGHGPGMRRGEDWCGRCACRKIVRGLCCGE